MAEGACVVGLAAVLSGKLAPQGPTATIITGRNLDMALFTKVMTGQTVILGDKVIEGRKYGT